MRARMRSRVSSRVRTFIFSRVRVRVYVSACARASVRSNIREFKCVCECSFSLANVHSCGCASFRVCVMSCLHICWSAFVRVFVYL